MRLISRLGSSFVFVALVGTGGCESKANICGDVVNTPGGPVPRACVHEAPNGSVVTIEDGGTTVVTVDGAVVATYPPCPCADAGS